MSEQGSPIQATPSRVVTTEQALVDENFASRAAANRDEQTAAKAGAEIVELEDRKPNEMREGGDNEDPDARKGSRQRTEIRTVTLADGTDIQKQIADFDDKDESKATQAKEKNDYLKKMEDLAEEEKELYRLSEPIPITNLMVNYPCCVIVSSFLVMITISIFVFYMGWLLPNNPHDRDYLVWGDKYVNDYDKTKLAAEELLISDTDEKIQLQSQSDNDWTAMLIYDAPSEDVENMWTKEALISVREFEKDIKLEDGYSQTCLAEPVTPGSLDDVRCSSKGFQSVLDLFSDPSKLELFSQAQLDQVLSNTISNSALWKSYKSLFDTQVSSTNLKVNFIRTIVVGAGPVKDGNTRYKNIKDRSLEQDNVATEFQKTLRSLANSGDEKYANARRRIFASLLYTLYFQETVEKDVAYATFSGMFVFCYIWFHLGSFFITSLSMLIILMSFPMTYLIYSGIFQVAMNTTLNQLTIFIVLGIAADDIFVYCDAWKQAGTYPSIATSELRRLSYAFKRSFRAILVTSTTTAVAFAANALSDIRPVRAFGIFAAILIPMVFVLLIMTVPAMQIIHDRHFKERCAYRKICCCCCLRKHDKSKNENQTRSASVEAVVKLGNVTVEGEKEVKQVKDSGKKGPEIDCMTKFCGTRFNAAVYKLRIGIIIGFFIIGIVAGVIASGIGPLTKEEEFLPSDHELMVFLKDIENNFPSSQELRDSVMVNLNWGVKDLDRSATTAWDSENMGKLVWDDDFKIAPARNQEVLIDLCTELRDTSSIVKDNRVTCWILDMKDYVDNGAACASGQKMPLTSETTFNNCLKAFLQTEAGIDHMRSMNLFYDFENERIKYMKVSAQSVGQSRDSRQQKIPIRDSWDALVEDFSENRAPDGLGNLYQEADVFWAWMQSEQAFFEGAKQGVSTSGALAFLILLFATRNILIALYAIKSVVFIVLCVVAVMVLKDWQLGVSESIAMVIIIGFSVDYVVHLAAHYVHSSSTSRFDKTTESVSAMGVSIFSGAMTTLGSGVFLFGGTLVFFQKFALIITTTVIFSLSYALIYFLAFMHTIGPQGKQGDIVYMWRSCRAKCKKEN